MAFAAKELNPNIKIYGVQAAGAPSMVESISQGKIVGLDSVSTLADGIAVKKPGDNTFELVSRYVDELVTVTESEICAAILYLLERHKLVAEGAGAVSVAAAMFGKLPLAGKKTVCVVSGGNVDVTIFNRIITRGLQKNGRMCRLSLEVSDRPGQLLAVTKLIADLGANVLGVQHDRSSATESINSCVLHISMETRNQEHIDKICKAVTKAGFHII